MLFSPSQHLGSSFLSVQRLDKKVGISHCFPKTSSPSFLQTDLADTTQPKHAMDVLEIPLLLIDNEPGDVLGYARPCLRSPDALEQKPLNFVERRDLQEDVVFQDIVTQLLVSQHLKRVDRLGSSELVQLRKSFQETYGKYKFQETQGEMRDLEADMRDLQVETIEGDDNCQAYYGEIKEVAQGGNAATDVKSDGSQAWAGLHLETKLQLGDMEFDEEDGECGSNNGKRRPSCGVVVSKFDVKRRRNDVVDVN